MGHDESRLYIWFKLHTNQKENPPGVGFPAIKAFDIYILFPPFPKKSPPKVIIRVLSCFLE
jgi:hypothetical protein